MTGNERRNKILDILATSTAAVPGHVLSQKLKVSRQVIVQDIALLRTAGNAITSTNRGYVLGGKAQSARLFKVKHGEDRLEDEMNAIVDLGGCISDVAVNHRTYGLVSAPLDIRSRRDVRRFMQDLQAGVSKPLSALTDGYHFHHITAETEDILDEIQDELDKLGFSANPSPFEKETLY